MKRISTLLLGFMILAAIGLHAQTIVCPGSPTYLTVGPHRGALQWEYTTNQGSTWLSIPNATSDTAQITPVGIAWYRAAITEGTCDPIYSDTSVIALSDLQADAGADTYNCGQGATLGGNPTAIGGTAPFVYAWTPSQDLSATNIANPVANPMVNSTYILTVTDANGCSSSDTVMVTYGTANNDSTVFVYTGATEFFVVPPCVTTVTINTWGASGENALVGGAIGGNGGFASGTLAVTPGETLYVNVGGQSGFNGGAAAGINGNDQFSSNPIGTSGGRGGDASDVRQGGTNLNNRVIVAGGGGGAGHNGVWPGCQVAGPGGNGGAGGGSIGTAGTFGVGTPCNCGGGGGGGGNGGSQAAGGTAGVYANSTACFRSSWTIGADGTLGLGGAGATSYHNGSGGGGGGGGGYYGGGAAANGSDTTPGGGGGGGSNLVTGLTNPTSLAGVRNGLGRIVIYH